jgi:branched-chain amino acid transport system permease protein
MRGIGQNAERFRKPLLVALWFSFLFLPFSGLRAAAVLFAVFAVSIPFLTVVSERVKKMAPPTERLGRITSKYRRYALLLLLPLFAVPFAVDNYWVDVAVLSGIYVILALGLNVVVGYTGLLNLGFAAFYAIGAYSYALLNTMLGIGFWSALPLSVVITTVAGFLLAFPALRLRGDYLAIVTLGFGEIVRLVLNNWDSLTKGPNGISGIDAPTFFGASLGNLSAYYYLVLFFVLLTVFVMRRVEDSKIGRAWIAIREDEIATSAMGISTMRYKLYACAFGAFWAGIAGCLFAAKMRFVSPESFTFMESVLMLCMVIIGGIGSISGVIVGAVLLVFLPELLREAQLYRMLVVGCGLVFLMVFRPQGIFGRKNVSLGS